jgi:hypothetical protein
MTRLNGVVAEVRWRIRTGLLRTLLKSDGWRKDEIDWLIKQTQTEENINKPPKEPIFETRTYEGGKFSDDNPYKSIHFPSGFEVTVESIRLDNGRYWYEWKIYNRFNGVVVKSGTVAKSKQYAWNKVKSIIEYLIEWGR